MVSTYVCFYLEGVYYVYVYMRMNAKEIRGKEGIFTSVLVQAFFEYQNIKYHENRPNKGPTSTLKKQWYVGAKVSCPTPISQVCSLDTDKWSLVVTRVYSSHGVQSV